MSLLRSVARPFRPTAWPSAGRGRRSPVAVVLLVAALLAGALPGGGRAQEGGDLPGVGTLAAAKAPPPGAVIVALKDGVDPAPLLRQLGVRPTYVYRRVFNGFAADLPAEALAALRRNRAVELISPDAEVFAARQEIPTGVDRIDADRNPRADIDGGGPPVDADIAILDTGIDRHPDLTIAGGKRCAAGRGFGDGVGHGTHVAGIAAAEDNGVGVVGVAPGARLWAVKVFTDEGRARWSNIVCGLDWVLEHGGIEVVNMSLGGGGRDGSCRSSNAHRAVCAVVEAGIPVVVAAGNDGQPVDRVEVDGRVFEVVPATWEETIAVSAFNDYDGRPGGDGAARCIPERFRRFFPEETFTAFSNFGPDVDIAAPGVCIRSTWKGGGYKEISGTSMATPHVTGAVALYLADRPNASVLDVRSWLRGTASVAQNTRFGFEGDPDRYHEQVLYLGPGGQDAAGA